MAGHTAARLSPAHTAPWCTIAAPGGGVAQRLEHGSYTAPVGGSNPPSPTRSRRAGSAAVVRDPGRISDLALVSGRSAQNGSRRARTNLEGQMHENRLRRRTLGSADAATMLIVALALAGCVAAPAGHRSISPSWPAQTLTNDVPVASQATQTAMAVETQPANDLYANLKVDETIPAGGSID